MDVVVDAATPADGPEAAQVLASALWDDAVVRTLVPGAADRVERLTAVYSAGLRLAKGRGAVVDVAREQATGRVVGVAIWEGPGVTMGGWSLVRETPALMRAVGARHLPAVWQAVRAFAKHRPRVAHWFLADLATSPDVRGRGVGSRLLAHRLEDVDRTGLPAYLEATTAGGRRLYERFAFRPTGSIHLPGATATGMLRPPGGV